MCLPPSRAFQLKAMALRTTTCPLACPGRRPLLRCSTRPRVIDRSGLPELRDSEHAVVVRHVTKQFIKPKRRRALPWRTGEQPVVKTPVRALNDVTFDVRRNEIFGILGANGSGKSTLIRVMSTLLIADSGKISVFGFDVREDEMQVKRLINRVSVEASFFKKLSAMENLLYAVRLYGRHWGRAEAGDYSHPG